MIRKELLYPPALWVQQFFCARLCLDTASFRMLPMQIGTWDFSVHGKGPLPSFQARPAYSSFPKTANSSAPRKMHISEMLKIIPLSFLLGVRKLK